MNAAGWPWRRLLADRAAWSGYGYFALAGLLNLGLVPLYLHWLGREAWGEVALCLGLLGALLAIESSLSALLMRDSATAGADAARLHRHYLRRYAGLAMLLLLAMQVGLGVLDAQRWPVALLRLVVLQFALQFCNLATLAIWCGRGQQVLAYRRQAIFLLLKHAAALLAIAVAGASAWTYVVAFTAVSALELGVNLLRGPVSSPAAGMGTATGIATATDMPLPAAPDLRPDVGRRDFPIVLLASTLTALGGHVDRLWMAPGLPRVDFGHYYLAGVVLLSLLHLAMPLQRAWLPRVAAAADPRAALQGWRRMLLAILVLPSLVAAIEPAWLLRLWLQDPGLAAELAPLLRLMLLAVVAFAAAQPGQALLWRHRDYRALAMLGGIALLLQVLVLAVLMPRLGMLAGGAAWLAAGLTQWGGSAWRIRRRGLLPR